MPVEEQLAKRLRAYAAKTERWQTEREERDRLIREAHAAGGSLREIAALVGLTNPAVHYIVKQGEMP